jgi:hypothetical protein
MRWNVEGADLESGEEKRITVSAGSAQEAEAMARKKGILVGRVWPKEPAQPTSETSTLLAYQSPEAFSPLGVPNYQDITTGASWVGILASVTAGLGWVVIILCTVAGLISMNREPAMGVVIIIAGGCTDSSS